MIPGVLRPAGITLALIGYAVAAGQANQSPAPLTVPAALDRYGAQPGPEVARRVAEKEFASFLIRYRNEAGIWISRGRIEARPERQRVAAAFAVELLAVSLDGSFREYQAAKPLVEWFCELLNSQRPSEVERMAMLASLAAIQGAGDSRVFGIESGSEKRKGHIDHALARFPDDDQLKLARLVERYELRLISTVPLMREVLPSVIQRTQEERTKHLNDTLAQLLALDGPRVRDEAQLRRGVLHFITGRTTLAMQDLGAAAVGEKPFTSYIANLMLGSMYYTGGNAAAAAARYSKAMHITPATSARLGLAAALMRLGETREAAATAMPPAPDQRVEDPWRLYGLGLFHELPAYLDGMRAALR